MFAIMAFIIILRIRKAIQGTKVDVKKTIIFSVYFIAVAFFLVYTSFLIGRVPFVYFVPYFAVAVTAVYCSYSYSKRAVSFWELHIRNEAYQFIFCI
jgi:Ca2+/Na+ antiporter